MARNRIEFAVRVRDDASANLQRISKEVDGLTSSLKTLAAQAISAATLVSVVRLADTYRLLTNRLRLVTSGTEELNAIQEALLDTANETRSSFSATADLYARVARSSRNLGLSQQDLIDFTRTVSQSIRISGSTAQEAAAGVIQFGQALASSRLSGDELRSVLEQMPRLAQAIAEGMGVGIGRLREMGEQGELTAIQVLAALRKEAAAIQSEFDRLQPLVSEALTTINNAIIFTIGEMDELHGASKRVAEVIIEFRDEFLELARIFLDAAKEGDQLSESTQSIAVGFVAAATAVKLFGRALFDTVSFIAGTASDIITTFIAQIVALTHLDLDTAANLGRDLQESITKSFVETFTDLNVALQTDLEQAALLISKIMGDVATSVRKGFDLTDRPAANIELTRAELALLAKDLKKAESVFLDTRTEVERFIIDMKELRRLAELFPTIITPAVFERRREQFLEGVVEDVEGLREAVDESFEFMQAAGKRAAENIQDAFADFLFDPFDKGLKGMLKGFLDVIRRMIAEILAFKIISSFSASSSIGAFFATGASSGVAAAAHGGPVSAGRPVLVGERGPELFIPNASGNIRSNAAMRGMGDAATFITNIDARGADPSLISRLPQIMEQRDRRLLIKMKTFVETGAVTI